MSNGSLLRICFSNNFLGKEAAKKEQKRCLKAKAYAEKMAITSTEALTFSLCMPHLAKATHTDHENPEDPVGGNPSQSNPVLSVEFL